MAGTVLIAKPTLDQAMATTFWVCGSYSGVDAITVQIFSCSTSHEDMEQLDSKPADLTPTIGGGGTWKKQFTAPADDPPSPAYLALVTGYKTVNGVTSASVAVPVRFYCVSTGGDASACGEIIGCPPEPAASTEQEKKTTKKDTKKGNKKSSPGKKSRTGK